MESKQDEGKPPLPKLWAAETMICNLFKTRNPWLRDRRSIRCGKTLERSQGGARQWVLRASKHLRGSRSGRPDAGPMRKMSNLTPISSELIRRYKGKQLRTDSRLHKNVSESATLFSSISLSLPTDLIKIPRRRDGAPHCSGGTRGRRLCGVPRRGSTGPTASRSLTPT